MVAEYPHLPVSYLDPCDHRPQVGLPLPNVGGVEFLEHQVRERFQASGRYCGADWSFKACWEAKGKAAFRPSGVLNAAVYEGVMIGVAERLTNKAKESPEPAALAAAYDKLLSDEKFLRICERATADEASVKNRRILAVSAFQDV